MATKVPFDNDYSAGAATIAPSLGEKTKAKDIAQYGVATIDKSASVYQAIALMIKKSVSGLPVTDETGLVGIISEKDVLELLCNPKFIAGRVGDYMSTSVYAFDENDELSDICRCLIENNFRRVPVLHEGKLAAIITRADLIKVNKDKFKPRGAKNKSSADSKSVVAKDVMKCGLLTVSESTTVYEAMEILATKNVTGLPVVDEFMKLVGMVSEKDILKLLYNDNAKPGMVKDYMTSKVTGFDRNTPLTEICQCLIDNNFRRVPILDKGKLVGIISRTDIMAYIMLNRSRFFSQKS